MTTLTDDNPLFRSFTFTPAERRVFAKKERLTPSEWAERYRTVPIGAHRGPWRNDISPHLVKIMDTWALTHVREVTICKAPQCGGTEAALNCMCYAMDRDPSTMMLIMPSEAIAKKVNADRIIPTIVNSPRLQTLISPNPDDMAKMRIKLQNGTLLYMAWANSATALSSFPIKYLFFDETDKYPPYVGEETDPITLGEKRTTTFPFTHKIFKVSTPTTESGPIWKAYQSADCQYKYHVMCPDCGKTHIMNLEDLKWPQELSPEEIMRDNLAWYECPFCKSRWNDIQKRKAVRLGKWQREKGKGIEKPRSVAFHLPAWISPDISLSEIAATLILSQHSKQKLIDLFNGYLAEPYIDKTVERQEDSILALRDDRPRGLVPHDVACLTCAVDTQARGFYYEIRAWGYGFEMESWQVREGFVEDFSTLAKIIFDDKYTDSAGNEYKIVLTLIDSGGGEGDFGITRTAQVYDFCRRFRNVIPIKGQQRMSQPYKIAHLDTYPGTNKPIPGGLKLYHINVTHYKDYLASKLMIAPTDPGAWHLHSEATFDYARQMTAEYKDEKGLWRCPKNRPNHFWDISVYNLAAADIIGVKYIKRPEQKEESGNERQQNTQERTVERRRLWG
jgi:phage terminase large subunit GpA-like protein